MKVKGYADMDRNHLAYDRDKRRILVDT